MNAWVYLFSKFTPEALLFEALAIFLLFAGYAAFWVLRKRKLGASDQFVPIGVVRSYLNQFIGDANILRQQLFGIMGGGEIPTGAAPRILTEPALAGAPIATAQIDHSLLAKIQLLEAQLAERAKIAEALRIEKENLAKQLTEMPAGAAAANASGDGASAAAMGDLAKKIKLLEDKLAEYSIIEDDLANLKRLQQENKELKEKLASMGGGAPAVSTPVAVAAPEPAVSEPMAAAAAEEPVTAAAPEPDPVELAPAEPIAAAAEPAAAEDLSAFESLVTEVEQSIAPATEPIAAAAPEAPAPVAAAKPAPAAAAPAASDDMDLVAEFEKMLNS